MNLLREPEKLNHPAAMAGRAPLSVVFVRHAQAEQRELGEGDPGLSYLGRTQARLLARRLAHTDFSHVYVSDLARARQTCDAILRRKLSPTTVTRDLREVAGSHGEPGMSRRTTPEAGDNLENEALAMHRFVSHTLNIHRAGETILVVAHGNVIRSLIALLADGKASSQLKLEFFNASVTVLDIWPSNSVVLRLSNSVYHLNPRQVT
jgi:2,3-bisphosphoglycerate-dependent phosphoglycerate mutase